MKIIIHFIFLLTLLNQRLLSSDLPMNIPTLDSPPRLENSITKGQTATSEWGKFIQLCTHPQALAPLNSSHIKDFTVCSKFTIQQAIRASSLFSLISEQTRERVESVVAEEAKQVGVAMYKKRQNFVSEYFRDSHAPTISELDIHEANYFFDAQLTTQTLPTVFFLKSIVWASFRSVTGICSNAPQDSDFIPRFRASFNDTQLLADIRHSALVLSNDSGDNNQHLRPFLNLVPSGQAMDALADPIANWLPNLGTIDAFPDTPFTPIICLDQSTQEADVKRLVDQLLKDTEKKTEAIANKVGKDQEARTAAIDIEPDDLQKIIAKERELKRQIRLRQDYENGQWVDPQQKGHSPSKTASHIVRQAKLLFLKQERHKLLKTYPFLGELNNAKHRELGEK